MAKQKAGGAQSKLKRIWRDRLLYLTLLPTLIYFFVFHVIPIIGMKLAFYDYRIKGDNVFVGFTYFKKLFSTPVFFSDTGKHFDYQCDEDIPVFFRCLSFLQLC